MMTIFDPNRRNDERVEMSRVVSTTNVPVSMAQRIFSTFTANALVESILRDNDALVAIFTQNILKLANVQGHLHTMKEFIENSCGQIYKVIVPSGQHILKMDTWGSYRITG